jgi:hypothetical protein
MQWAAYALLSIVLAALTYSLFYAVVMRSKIHRADIFFDYSVVPPAPPLHQDCSLRGTCRQAPRTTTPPS